MFVGSCGVVAVVAVSFWFAFAVLRLMTKSTFVGCTTGKSPIKVATSPTLTGSPQVVKTIGVVVVGTLAANAAGVVSAASTLTEVLLVSHHHRSILWWLRIAGFVLPSGVARGWH